MLAVADPIARSGAEAGSAISRVGEFAAAERQAAAADAAGEPLSQALQLGDAPVDASRPSGGEAGPVRPFRDAPGREFGEFQGNFVERHPDALGEYDEGDPSQDGPGIAAVTGAGPFGLNQASFFIEAQCRRRHAAAAGNFADSQHRKKG